MIALRKLDVFQFRNYEKATFSFQENIVAISGKNGSGKTNLLDAIYYLCFTKSFFPRTDAQSVMRDHIGFRIAGYFVEAGESLHVACILRETGKKEFQVDHEMIKKFSHHIGRIPCVMIAPDDVEIIQGSSELRRRLIDTILSQIDKDYLQDLIDYNKILQQRNSLLKSDSTIDYALLDILDTQLSQKGIMVYSKRKDFATNFPKIVQAQYTMISQKSDDIQIAYQSPLDTDSLENILLKNRSKDQLLQRTTSGIHRDDLSITMDGVPFKNMASQGQRKSLLFALRLAEYQILEKYKQKSPILLMDDVFEKLDGVRMEHLLKTVCGYKDSMIFLTDTHPERLEDTFRSLNVPFQLIKL